LLFKNYNATEFFAVSLEDDDLVAGLEHQRLIFAHRFFCAALILARAAAELALQTSIMLLQNWPMLMV
jgi:hypothetical protein